jgi:hypothetical protein
MTDESGANLKQLAREHLPRLAQRSRLELSRREQSRIEWSRLERSSRRDERPCPAVAGADNCPPSQRPPNECLVGHPEGVDRIVSAGYII